MRPGSPRVSRDSSTNGVLPIASSTEDITFTALPRSWGTAASLRQTTIPDRPKNSLIAQDRLELRSRPDIAVEDIPRQREVSDMKLRVLLPGAVMLTIAGLARADAHLISSVPADNSVFAHAPSQIS